MYRKEREVGRLEERVREKVEARRETEVEVEASPGGAGKTGAAGAAVGGTGKQLGHVAITRGTTRQAPLPAAS